MRPLPSRLLVVTERPAGDPATVARQFLGTVETVLGAGIRWLWFRERDLPPEARRHLAEGVARIARMHGAALTIGGDAALAADLGADGVHLPGGATADDVARARALLPNGSIGLSAHGLGDIETAARGGADYATLSPIFATASKPGYGPALGLEAVRAAARFGLPVIALGGMDPARIRQARGAGAFGAAIMGGIMRASDAGLAARACLEAAGEKP